MLRAKNIFLIDGLGALVTAFFLGVVLPYFEPYIGMPKVVLYWLAGVAASFALFSLTCYFLALKRWPSFLLFIAICNLIYCLISLSLLIFFRAQIMPLGWIYFILEILIIVSLALLELQSANTPNQAAVK